MKTKPNKAIKYLREAIGQTQAQFAAMLGLAKITVTCWETGKNRLEPRAAAKIHAATGAAMEDLLNSRVPVRDYLYGIPCTVETLKTHRRLAGDQDRIAAEMSKTACEELSTFFSAGARPGRLGNKYRLPAMWESFMNWIQDAAKDFDINPQVEDMLREKKIPDSPYWWVHHPGAWQIPWDPVVRRESEEMIRLRRERFLGRLKTKPSRPPR